MESSKQVHMLVVAAACLALCMFLPFLTAQIPEIGSMLLPMHIPVLLCGFLCGWPYGMAVGFAAPLLRFLFFGMPPILPTGIAMAFELAAYGVLAGMLYRRLPDKPIHIYTTLVLAMLGGRIVWGIASWVIYTFMGNPFTFELFLAGAFIKAAPGILLHIVLIPVIVLALRKAKILQYARA